MKKTHHSHNMTECWSLILLPFVLSG